jgi:hypothetical protein
MTAARRWEYRLIAVGAIALLTVIMMGVGHVARMH